MAHDIFCITELSVVHFVIHKLGTARAVCDLLQCKSEVLYILEMPHAVSVSTAMKI